MNFEVFNSLQELEARLEELKGVAVETITGIQGNVFTLKWRG